VTPDEPQQQQRQTQPSKAILGYLFAALAAAGWASGALIGKWLMTEPSAETAGWLLAPLGAPLSAEVLSAERVLLAGIIMLAVILIRSPRDLKVSPKGLGQLALYGVIGLAGLHYTYYSAIDMINPSTAILIDSLAPVLIMVFGVVVLKDRPTWRLPAGIILALFGAMLVTGTLLPGEHTVNAQGVAFAFASALFFAFYSLMGDFCGKRYRTSVVTTFGMCFAALFWLLLLGPKEVLHPLTNLPVMLTLLVTVLFSTILATLSFLKALKYIKPANATMTCILEPFLVALGEFAFFHEMLAPIQLAGGLLVILAVLVVLSADMAKSREQKSIY
jgi:drug/metabolite transporter (DMT)-like permease